MKKAVLAMSLFFLLAGAGGAPAEDGENEKEFVIKIATIVPEMGSMADMFTAFKKELSERTNNKVKVIIYFGAVMGDETDTVRKMRLGQLQGGGMTLLGLGQLCPASKVIELPFLFNDFDEIDYVVMNKMRPAFDRLFEEKGIYLVGWYDTGFGYYFFKDPVNSFDDIRKTKMVTFNGDQLFTDSERASGFENLIPMHISETLTGLQTGLLTGTFSPFFALVGLQWNTHVKYVLNHPISYSVAGLVIDKAFVDKMPPAYKTALFESMKKYEPAMIKEIRRMEKETYDSLLKRGLTQIPEDKALPIVEEMKKRAQPLYNKFIDHYYPSWLISGILNALAQYRQEKAAK